MCPVGPPLSTNRGSVRCLFAWGREIYRTFDEELEIVYDDMEGFLVQFNQIVQLQARIKTLENTLEYLTRSPALSDGR